MRRWVQRGTAPIREIPINSNPFTPEFHKLGYGRIEIFTKPGSDKFHGSVGYSVGTEVWNASNPYASAKGHFFSRKRKTHFWDRFRSVVPSRWISSGNRR
ncbi:MAG TPA: hypothetical protein VH639_22185 [Bryobacteraceae bacterium]|jgi:hypothetical protein